MRSEQFEQLPNEEFKRLQKGMQRVADEMEEGVNLGLAYATSRFVKRAKKKFRLSQEQENKICEAMGYVAVNASLNALTDLVAGLIDAYGEKELNLNDMKNLAKELVFCVHEKLHKAIPNAKEFSFAVLDKEELN